MRPLADFDPPDLQALFASWGHPASHAQRLLKAFYDSAGEPDLPALQLGRALTARIQQEIPIRGSSLRLMQQAADGTQKMLIDLPRGESVETVLMTDYRPDRAAGCLSTQVGCPVGCDFCASTRGGLQRNLASWEIVEQFLYLRRQAATLGRRIATIVFMGIGEPLLNLDHLLPAIRRIIHPRLGALGGKQVTVSTAGVVPGIQKLADANLNIHLALSLHAPDDETRSRLVPLNRRWPIAQVLDAARQFQRQTRRPVTIGYCLLAGLNDSDDHAHRLADLVRDFGPHVNLIPYNTIGQGLSGQVYLRPSPQRVQCFLEILRQQRIVTHCRRPRGDDIAAACGQLRHASA